MTKLHVIHEHSLCDVPAVMREIADEIEAGGYGTVQAMALVLDGDTIHNFYAGTGAYSGSSHMMLLQLGIHRMCNAIIDVKESNYGTD